MKMEAKRKVSIILIILIPTALMKNAFPPLWISGLNRPEISIDIDRGELNYIVANVKGLGPKKLDYESHQIVLDRFITMVNGEYSYVKLWSNEGQSGGGPYSVRFISKSDEIEYALQYINGHVAVSTDKRSYFYLYAKNEGQLQFDEFEAYLIANGK